MSEKLRSPTIPGYHWPSKSSNIIHYRRKWHEMLIRPKTQVNTQKNANIDLCLDSSGNQEQYLFKLSKYNVIKSRLYTKWNPHHGRVPCNDGVLRLRLRHSMWDPWWTTRSRGRFFWGFSRYYIKFHSTSFPIITHRLDGASGLVNRHLCLSN